MIRAAQHDVLVQLVAAQIEEAIFEPHVLGILLIAEDRQRQLRRRAQNLDRRHIDFDEARRHLRIFGAGRALAHGAVDAHHPFRAQLFRQRKGRRIRIDDALGDAVMIAQVDEQHAAMVADAMTPAGKSDFGIGLRLAQVAARVSAITMHVLSRRKRHARRRAKTSVIVERFIGIAEAAQAHRQADLVAGRIDGKRSCRPSARLLQCSTVGRAQLRRGDAGARNAALPLELHAPFVVLVRPDMHRAREGNIGRQDDDDTQGIARVAVADRNLGQGLALSVSTVSEITQSAPCAFLRGRLRSASDQEP